jgi:hypothetical protein
MIVLGKIYRHFKGNYYRVLELATDANTLERLVVYQALYDDKIWVRPLSEFTDVLTRSDRTFERFQEVAEEDLISLSDSDLRRNYRDETL